MLYQGLLPTLHLQEGLVPVVIHKVAGGKRGGDRERARAKEIGDVWGAGSRSHLTCILWFLFASLISVRSVSTMNLSEKSSVVIPPPDYLERSSTGAAAEKKGVVSQNASTFKAPVSKPETTSPNDANGFAKPPFL
ncbi:hypothetical protein E2I00_004744, partial [Balaenoptera physalus]